MNAEQRSGPSNGMWLCSNCHDTIDRDTDTYPTPVLKQMKKDAEDRIRRELGVATVDPARSSVSRSKCSELVSSISAVAILEVRQVKARFLEAYSRGEELEEHAEQALGGLAFLDFEQDEYMLEVSAETLLVLREIVHQCKVPTINLKVLRRVKAITDSFNSKWKGVDQVQVVCQIVERAVLNSNRKRSRVFQSGLALLKDLSSYKALKAKKWNEEPLSVIRMLRSREEVDADEPTPNKRPHVEEDVEEKYLSLMETLAHTTDTDKILEIEQQIEEIGYEACIQ